MRLSLFKFSLSRPQVRRIHDGAAWEILSITSVILILRGTSGEFCESDEFLRAIAQPAEITEQYLQSASLGLRM